MTQRKFFGTDGMRGLANVEPITPGTMLALALAAGAHFQRGDHRHRVIIGKDTRLSGYMLESALTGGFLAMGMDVLLLGPLPTPAVARLTRSMRADLGLMISASHNPYCDNGIKLFGPDGYKLSDAIEAAIEARMAASDLAGALPTAEKLGRAKRLDDAPGRYIEFVKASLPKGFDLEGRRIVVDCAHGAAYKVAPIVLGELGAKVIPLGVAPDGTNINHDCGAVHPGRMQAAVIEISADLGIALDGDADRVILADEKGRLIDGDQLLGALARDQARQGRLARNGVVATQMSNLGLERYLDGLGIALHRAPVGDRYVVERMRAEGCNLGGESSGHIVLADFATTGDGLIAALQALAILTGEGKPASASLRVFQPLPQLLKNIRRAPGAPDPLAADAVRRVIAEAEKALAGRGRLLIRKSGTEPVLRLMAEADDERLIAGLIEGIAEAIAAADRKA